MPFYKEIVQVNPSANPCNKQLGGHLLPSPTSDPSQVPVLSETRNFTEMLEVCLLSSGISPCVVFCSNPEVTDSLF